MTPGQVVLLRLPQPDTSAKKILFARSDVRKFGVGGGQAPALVCGVSSQLHQELPKVPSLIRLNWLASVSPTARAGTLGSIAPERLAHLRTRLAAHLALPYPP